MVDRESASVDMFSGLDDRRRTVDIDAEYAQQNLMANPYLSTSRERLTTISDGGGGAPEGEWAEYQTAEGESYYFNADTNETTWDKPKNVVKQSEFKFDVGVVEPLDGRPELRASRAKSVISQLKQRGGGFNNKSLAFPTGCYEEYNDDKARVEFLKTITTGYDFTGKKLLLEGPLEKTSKSGGGFMMYQFLLLDHDLVYVEPRGTRYVVHRAMPISTTRVSTTTSRALDNNENFSFSILTPAKSFIVRAPDGTSMRRWLKMIEAASRASCFNKGMDYDNPPQLTQIWTPDSDVLNCELCQEAFNSIMRRRHHCRQCGKAVCAGCSASSKMVVGHLGAVRVCKDCSSDDISTSNSNRKTVHIVEDESSSHDSTSRDGITVKGIGEALANFGTGGASFSNLPDAVIATRLLLVLRAAKVSDKLRCRCNLFTEVPGDICGAPSAVREDGLHMCWRCAFLEVVTGTDATFAKQDAPLPPRPTQAGGGGGGGGGLPPPPANKAAALLGSEERPVVAKQSSRFLLGTSKSFKGSLNKPKSPPKGSGREQSQSPPRSLPSDSMALSDQEAVRDLSDILLRALVSDSSLCSSNLYTVDGSSCGRPASLDPQTKQPTDLCWQCKRVEAYTRYSVVRNSEAPGGYAGSGGLGGGVSMSSARFNPF